MGRPEVRTTSPLPRVSRRSGARARPPEEGRAETHHLPRAQAFRTALVRRAAIVSASERDARTTSLDGRKDSQRVDYSRVPSSERLNADLSLARKFLEYA